MRRTRHAAAAQEFLSSETELQAGSRCDIYELVRLLGRRGMGAVFLAQRSDGEVAQRVAIKFACNLAADPGARSRFLRERQFLASLNHPGTARLLDAGHTAEGQPYLVMECVEEVPLDVYSEKLDLPGKLGLFLKVCAALAYAHCNLVIHRDLKPSNILVDSTGQPKLLDFGIARMLDDATIPALTRDRVLLPPSLGNLAEGARFPHSQTRSRRRRLLNQIRNPKKESRPLRGLRSLNFQDHSSIGKCS